MDKILEQPVTHYLNDYLQTISQLPDPKLRYILLVDKLNLALTMALGFESTEDLPAKVSNNSCYPTDEARATRLAELKKQQADNLVALDLIRKEIVGLQQFIVNVPTKVAPSPVVAPTRESFLTMPLAQFAIIDYIGMSRVTSGVKMDYFLAKLKVHAVERGVDADTDNLFIDWPSTSSELPVNNRIVFTNFLLRQADSYWTVTDLLTHIRAQETLKTRRINVTKGSKMVQWTYAELIDKLL